MKYLWISLFWTFSLQASTVSIIVPCYHGHFHYLSNLMTHLNQQTELPAEVVISLSEANKLPKGALEAFMQASLDFPFQINVITSNRVQLAGENRNIACNNATGDILICQDADDLLHPQRIEIVHHYFDNYRIDLLIHKWMPSPESPMPTEKEFYTGNYEIPKIPLFFPRPLNAILNFDYGHMGNLAIRKAAMTSLKWPTHLRIGEDRYFVILAHLKHKKIALLDANLLIYRNYLSSHAP